MPGPSEAGFDISPPADYGILDINTLEFANQPRTVEISLVESEHMRIEREAREQAEKARAAELARIKAASANRTTAAGTVANKFVRGQCTWYAASKFPVTWQGNASAWPTNAAAQGYQVNRQPEAGALLVTWENSAKCPGCGHVTYIDKIVGDTMFISEMNFAAAFVVTHRQIPIDSPLIRAVIHRL